jgi:hypothetical protein
VVERHLGLVHGLEETRLGLGRGAVDLVGEHDIREDRTGLEHELVLVGLVDRHAEDVGRQHVRRELDPLESGAE